METAINDWGVFGECLNSEAVMNCSHEIDEEIATSSLCPSCGHHMHYRGFHKLESYRAFAVCYICAIAQEF